MSALLLTLQQKVRDLKQKGTPGDVIVNALKEELHLPVLHFIYNASNYGFLVMHGGTLLRQVYDLSRMSEDLDFETSHQVDAAKFQHDLQGFLDKNIDGVSVTLHQSATQEVMTFMITFDGLLQVLEVPDARQNLKIRVDIHYLAAAGAFPTTIHPLVQGRYVIGIRGYTMSILMATKTVALLKRDVRNIRGKDTNCKPRDVFDMLWYLEQGLLPDLRYIRGRGIEVANLGDLIELVRLRIASLKDNAFREDLAQFFPEEGEFTLWADSWRQRAEYLLANYTTVKILDPVSLSYGIDVQRDVHFYHFRFSTEREGEVKFTCRITEEFLLWAKMKDVDTTEFTDVFEGKIQGTMGREAVAFAAVFFGKIATFLKGTERVVPMYKGALKTKMILYTRQPSAPGDQVHLDEQSFLAAAFEDLL